ncbi:MAG: hypothetical protein KJ880_08645, partial [Candidatus Omnitrophica bacterium]|nr:hypothetical protein [Candidatus Omnitrophota bacterium]
DLENYYWDHLPGSTLTKRTINDEKYVTLNLRPFDKRKDFSLRPYFNWLQRNSDDIINSAESATYTTGFSLNDSLDEKTNYGANYEYRGYSDEAYDTSTEFFHRIGFNFSREQEVFGRRLYFSIEPGVSLRNAKGLSDKQDVNSTFSANGQYSLLEKLTSRFGYNMQNDYTGRPNSDYVNQRTFLEFDLLFSKKKGAHFVVRGERNIYCFKDSNQDYTESRAIGKFVSNF